MARTGGYDACFVESLSEQHTCPICYLALRNPKMTDCGHQFCETCLPSPTSGKVRSVRCPTCRCWLEPDKIYPNNMVKREILGLKILCDEHEAGCQWKGQLKDREEHMAECVYITELCDNKCGRAVMRRDMKKHKRNGCPKRRANCLYCDAGMQYECLEGHLDVCHAFPVPCVYHCGETVARGKMAVHTGKQGSCTESCLQCEFEHMGCSFNGNRKELELHLTQAAVSHLTMMASSFQSRLEIAEKKAVEAEEKLTKCEQERVAREQEMQARLRAMEGRLASYSSSMGLYSSRSGKPMYMK
ncbi:TNF receptor-associated factor 4-like [Corticium candelabrum]|uniref:TNF receptor-associated factor 4-like n=1 Tax=Corticium candelabrum TaxID=121492 RepID=UPI002E2658DD|nr:TNF receptor-associated factor 4-like [Corticium candelabrum]